MDTGGFEFLVTNHECHCVSPVPQTRELVVANHTCESEQTFVGKRDELQMAEKRVRMRGNLKIYWLNFAVVLSVLAGSAVWQAREADKSTLETAGASPDGRYHWAEVGRDVVLEVKDGVYTETRREGASSEWRVTSTGSCLRFEDGVQLTESDSENQRELDLSSQGLHESTFQTERIYERCNHPTALTSLGANPFNVDGVKLGMNKAEVEAEWGELSNFFHCGVNYMVGPTPHDLVSFDNSGLVNFVAGRQLYEFATPLSWERLLSYGHASPSYGRYGVYQFPCQAERIVDDYHISVFRFDSGNESNQESLEPYTPKAPNAKYSVSLTYYRGSH